MKNPLYYTIEAYQHSPGFPIQETILSRQGGQQNLAYFLIQLPKPHDLELDLNGKKLTGDEQHVTIFEEQSHREKYLSAYHYTLTLKAEPRSYKIHVYFNRYHHIDIEPYLIDIETDVKTPLPTDLKDQLYAHTIRLVKPISDKIRALQTRKIGELQTEDDQLNEQASILSQDLKQNKHEYIRIVEQRIQVLSRLNCYLTDPKSSTMTVSQQIVNTLKAQPELPAQDEASSSTAPSSATHPTTTSHPSASAKKKGKQKAVSTVAIPTERNDQQLEEYLNDLKNRTALFKQSRSLDEKFSHITRCEVLIRMCSALATFSPNILLQNKTARYHAEITNIIKTYFSTSLSTHDPLLKQKLQFLVSIRDQYMIAVPYTTLLWHALQEDNTDLMTLILSLDPANAQTKRYALDPTQPNKEYTLPEWCALLNRPLCFGELLTQGYSPYQNIGPDSPFLATLDNLKTFSNFFNMIAAHSTEKDQVSALKNASKIYTLLMKDILNPDELAILNVRAQQLQLTAQYIQTIGRILPGGPSSQKIAPMTAGTMVSLIEAFPAAAQETLSHKREFLEMYNEYLEIMIQIIKKLDHTSAWTMAHKSILYTKDIFTMPAYDDMDFAIRRATMAMHMLVDIKQLLLDSLNDGLISRVDASGEPHFKRANENRAYCEKIFRIKNEFEKKTSIKPVLSALEKMKKATETTREELLFFKQESQRLLDAGDVKGPLSLNTVETPTNHNPQNKT